MENAKRLADLNPLAEFGITKFSDQTEEEMLQRMGDFPDDFEGEIQYSYQYANSPNEEYDWRGHQQSVQDQGKWGSCWSFAATATIETYLSILKQNKVKLSEQQLVDCVSTWYGCNGGLANLAYDYLKDNQFCTLESYKYNAVQGECKQSTCKSITKVAGSTIIATGETGILAQLEKGPISVSVDASTWSSYRGGVMTNGCGSQTNHAVVVSAYFESCQGPYWVIRNSWGNDWGVAGHIFLMYGANLCNIEKRPSYPTL